MGTRSCRCLPDATLCHDKVQVRKLVDFDAGNHVHMQWACAVSHTGFCHWLAWLVPPRRQASRPFCDSFRLPRRPGISQNYCGPADCWKHTHWHGLCSSRYCHDTDGDDTVLWYLPCVAHSWQLGRIARGQRGIAWDLHVFAPRPDRTHMYIFLWMHCTLFRNSDFRKTFPDLVHFGNVLLDRLHGFGLSHFKVTLMDL